MWDERYRFRLFHAWRGIQWRKCYINHLTETVLAGSCRFNVFFFFFNENILQKNFFFLIIFFPCILTVAFWNPFPPGTLTGKLGAVLAFINKRLWHFCEQGHLHVYRLPLLPRTSALELWTGLLPSKAGWFVNYLLQIILSFPTTSVCCIISVDIAMWEKNFYRGRIDSFLVFFCYSKVIVSYHHRAQHWQPQAPDCCLK